MWSAVPSAPQRQSFIFLYKMSRKYLVAVLALFFLCAVVLHTAAGAWDCHGPCKGGGPCELCSTRNGWGEGRGHCCRKFYSDPGCGTMAGCLGYHCCVNM